MTMYAIVFIESNGDFQFPSRLAHSMESATEYVAKHFTPSDWPRLATVSLTFQQNGDQVDVAFHYEYEDGYKGADPYALIAPVDVIP